MLRSVKNLSDELGVEKFRIYKYIKDNDLKVTHLGSSKIMYFDDREAEKIIRAFTPELSYEDEHGEPMGGSQSAPAPAAADQTADTVRSAVREEVPAAAPAAAAPEAEPTPAYDSLVLQLRRELEEKNQQIDSMNAQLTNMTGALRNANDCIKRLAEGTRNLTESLRASQAMYLNAIQSISEEQEKSRYLLDQVAEAEAGKEAAEKEAAEHAEAVREATERANSAKEAAERAVALAKNATKTSEAGTRPTVPPPPRRRSLLERLLGR